MEILLATANAHKKEEIKRIVYPHKVLIPPDIGIDFDVEETGTTYLDNALIKARELSVRAGGRAIIADDSGLSVPALGGAPGVYSARYGSKEAGRKLTSQECNALLLQNMSHLKGDDRSAFFVCCMVLMLNENRIFSAQETLAGSIGNKAVGQGGFGYDPIFFLPSFAMSVAEISAEEKDRISHRGLAGLRIKAILDNLESLPAP